ncbi:MAG TPA: heparan-alpha-glucosaminide N-acetyltransferase domain-containing protein [Gemmatimonadaceae bacterium]|nr:heparan-alpha-glucosaminide N-acetyltransferase domain-containing protein [Gemmatimonadaceae bacterium]
MIPRSEYTDAAARVGRDKAIWQRPSRLHASERSERPDRIGSIDAVRGAAMLIVCLAHFSGVYLWQTGARDLVNYLAIVGRIASPTFVTVSGMVAGFLAVTNPRDFGELRIKLLDRGVFLLVVGHALLALTVTPSLPEFVRVYRVSFITDAIAAAIIVGPSLVTVLSGRARLSLAASVFCVSWFAVVQWHPGGAALVPLKRYFVGAIFAQSGESGSPVFAVIPWFAVYLAATALGEHVGKMYATRGRRGADHFLARVGGTCFLVGGLLHGATMVLRRVDPSVISLDPNLLTFFSIYQKFPPGPVYLAFFGGFGLVLLAAILEIERRRALPTLMSRLRQIGRASLFTFVAQYGVYVSFIGRLRLPYTPLWPLLFVASIILLAQGAAVWDGCDGNHFLTVGIFPMLRRRTLRSRSARLAGSNPDLLAAQSSNA